MFEGSFTSETIREQSSDPEQSVAVEKQSSKKLIYVTIGACVLMLAFFVSIWERNHAVNGPLQKVIESNPSNHVVKANAHLGGWLNSKTLVFDITDLSGEASRIDVFRVFLQYAQQMDARSIDSVILDARGVKKFKIDGSYFQELGREYATQNPMYTIRIFPTRLTPLDGKESFSEYEGGILGVLNAELKQFTEFSDRWYGIDFAESREKMSSSSVTSSLEDFDPCTSIRERDPHCGWKPHWDASPISINAIDGVKTQFLSLESTDSDGIDGDRLHFAELRICFENGKLCGGNHVSLGIKVHGMLASLGYESEYSTPVRLKFDEEPPVRQTWGISDNHEMLFPSGREREFLTQIAQHKKLIVEFSYYEKAEQTISFDLAGLSEKMHSENLAPNPTAQQQSATHKKHPDSTPEYAESNLGINPSALITGKHSHDSGGSEIVQQQDEKPTVPQVLYAPDPEFSDEARRAKYQGICVVEVTVDTQGSPQNVHVVRPLGMGLDEKAVAAVQQYKFRPATSEGKPVAVNVDLEVNFRIY